MLNKKFLSLIAVAVVCLCTVVTAEEPFIDSELIFPLDVGLADARL